MLHFAEAKNIPNRPYLRAIRVSQQICLIIRCELKRPEADQQLETHEPDPITVISRPPAAEGTGWQGHFAPPVATSRRKLCTMNSMSSSSLISLKLLSTVT